MGKIRGVHETTPEVRNRMVGMYEAGLGLREIAAAVNCSQRTVKRWLNRFDKEGTVETRDRCGRKRATTEEQDEAIIRLATETSITAAKTVLPALGLKCSVDTVRERLHKAGIHNWSPCKNHILKIPINATDGVEIQHTVWRTTGTQLRKRKIAKEAFKTKNHSFQSKNKTVPEKGKFKQSFDEHGVLNNTVELSDEVQNFSFSTLSQNEQIQPQINEMQSIFPLPPLQSHPVISTNSNQYNHPLNLITSFQPIYHHSGFISQNWPLDLVQSTQNYSESQQNSILQEQSTLYIQSHSQLQTHHDQNLIQHLQDQLSPSIHSQQHSILQPEVDQHHKLTEISTTKLNGSQDVTVNICSDVCSNSNSSCNENSQNSSILVQTIDIISDNNCCINNKNKNKERIKKKKGGKIKGTLETSIEMRNRMIGMSEAGLSTLSIALAINRSERTVKRWLERWHKEGNVQTKERKGRRRITTKAQDDAIVAMATENPLTAAKHVAPALGLTCSVDTVRERLHKAGIHSWKLGKKQGLHIWHPSGNRINKLKTNANKKKESSIKKEISYLNHIKKQGEEVIALKTTTPVTSMVSQESNMQSQNQIQSQTILENAHDLSSSLIGFTQPQFSQVSSLVHIPQVEPIIHQKSECRLALSTILPSISNQTNLNITYPSCMTGSTHTANIEQTDPINYEPYIWSF